MLLLIICALFVCFIQPATGIGNQEEPAVIEIDEGWCEQDDCTESERLWSEVLCLSALKTDSARTQIEQIKSAATNNAVRRLCDILLDEWDLSESDPARKVPRIVYTPKGSLPDDAIVGASPLARVLFRLSISAEGEVLDATVVTSLDASTALIDCVRRRYLRTRFRPALGSDGYARTSQVVEFRMAH